MTRKTATIKSKYGIHARSSYAIYRESEKFPDTKIILLDPCSENQAQAKNIFSLLTLNKLCGEKVEVCTEGKQEKEAAQSVAQVIETFDV